MPTITAQLVEDLTSSRQLPSPAEQAELLIIWLGDELVAPGRFVKFDPLALSAIIGGLDESGVTFILDALKSQESLTWKLIPGLPEAQLTFKGWQKYQEVRRSRSESGVVPFAVGLREVAAPEHRSYAASSVVRTSCSSS
jgi:hypothetical protein